METPSPERDLYQGILQIGLAYYQITRGNYRGALKMFRRGQRNLLSLEEGLLGIDIARLQSDARSVERTLRLQGEKGIHNFDRSLFKPVPRV